MSLISVGSRSRAAVFAIAMALQTQDDGLTMTVQGRAVHLREAGTDGPVVVLESGLGDGLQVWQKVQREVAAFGQTIAYDRAGLGSSAASSDPRTPVALAKELNTLLEALNARGPFVLVGHSTGGLYIRTYAALYPEKVGALVLVDATPEQMGVEFSQRYPDQWALELRELDNAYDASANAVHAEWLAIRTLLQDGVLPLADKIPDVPTISLCARQPSTESSWITTTPDGLALMQELKEAFPSKQSDAQIIPVMGVGHYIQLERPEVVVASIREACRAVQSAERLRTWNGVGFQEYTPAESPDQSQNEEQRAEAEREPDGDRNDVLEDCTSVQVGRRRLDGAGFQSSVSGGQNRSASGTYNWAAGSLSESN